VAQQRWMHVAALRCSRRCPTRAVHRLRAMRHAAWTASTAAAALTVASRYTVTTWVPARGACRRH
jgi:hypothetical protein